MSRLASLMVRAGRCVSVACGVGVLVLVLVGVVGVGSAVAGVVAVPAWQVTMPAFPSVMPTTLGKHGVYYVMVENVGGAASEGEVMIKDVLPAGLSVSGVRVEPEEGPSGEKATCPYTAGEVTCGIPERVIPSGFLVLTIDVTVTGSLSSQLTNSATVSGGLAATVSDEKTTRSGSEDETGPSGISQFRFDATGPAGEPVNQAGGHPTFLTATLLFNTVFNESVREPLETC